GASRGRRATPDEASAALDALGELGAVVRASVERVFNKTALLRSGDFRAGVRAGLAARGMESSRVRLYAALPPGLDVAIETELRRLTEDLRGGLVDLIAGARADLVLASPFWDAQTLEEMSAMLSGRLDAGVRVRILGRFVRDTASLSELASRRGCELF